MRTNSLQPPPDMCEADWIAARLGRYFGTVITAVPAGFAAYARLLHPASAPGGAPVRWEDIARRCGRAAHACMQFAAIAKPSPRAASASAHPDLHAPRTGELAPELLLMLCQILSRHTGTPDQCCFALWEGWGWLGELSAEDICLSLPGRSYLLLQGPLSGASEIGYSPRADWFIAQSPNLFWPHDRAWCVASEIDFDSTLIGGSEDLVSDLINDPGLEAWRVLPDDSLAHDADVINT